MADLQSRLGGKLPKNIPDGPANDLKKRIRPRIRRKARGAHGYSNPDSNSYHPHTNFSSIHSRWQDVTPQNLSTDYAPHAYRAGFNSAFEAHSDTPTNTESAVSNANVNSLVSTSLSHSSLLSRLSPGNTGGTNTRLDVSYPVPSLIDRITAKVEDREKEAASSEGVMMSPEQSQMGVAMDVDSLRNGQPIVEQIAMNVDLNPCGETLTKPPLTNNLPLESPVAMQNNEPADLVSLDNHSEPPLVTVLNDHSHPLLHNNQVNNKIQSDLISNDVSAPTSLIDPNIVRTGEPNSLSTSDSDPLRPGSPTSEAAFDSPLQPDIEVDPDPDQTMIVGDNSPPADVTLTPSVDLDPSGQPQVQQQSQPTDRNADRPRSSTPALVRHILLPVILENAKRRARYLEEQTHPEKVEDGARNVLTDEVCDVLIGNVQAVRSEMQARRAKEGENRDCGQEVESLGCVESGNSGGRVNVSGDGMSSDAGQRLDGIASSMSSTTSAIPHPSSTSIPTHTDVDSPTSSPTKEPPKAPKAMLMSTNVRAMETFLSTNSATATNVELALPKRPQWKEKVKADPDYDYDYESRKRRGRTDSTPSLRDDLLLAPPPLSRFNRKDLLRAHRMRSDSTSGPSTRTPPLPYGKPQGIAIPMDPQFFAHPPNGKDRGRTDSLSPNRYPHHRRRRSSRSLSPHRSPSPSHSKFRSYSPLRKAYSPRRQRLRSPSPPYHIHNNRTRRRSRSRSRSVNLDASVHSSILSDSYLNSHPNSHFHETETPISSAFDQLEDQEPIHIQTPPPPPISSTLQACHNVPALWFVKTGLDIADILEFSFDVDEETAVMWDLADDIRSIPTPRSKRKHRPTLSLHLLCLPTHLVKSTYQSLDPTTVTAEGIAAAMWNIKTEWPPKGKLVIEVNPKYGWGRTWLPVDLDPASPPLNFSTCIRGGTNNVRFIQLGGLSEYMFVLHASQSSDALEKRQHLDPHDMQSRDINPSSDVNRSLADLNSFLTPRVVALNLRPDNTGLFKFQTKVKLS